MKTLIYRFARHEDMEKALYYLVRNAEAAIHLKGFHTRWHQDEHDDHVKLYMRPTLADEWFHVATFTPIELLYGRWSIVAQHHNHTGDTRADDRENQQTMNTASPTPTSNPLHTQVGGSHYRDMAIQPAEYCHANKIGKLEGDVIAYVSRHRSKNGREDIEKAIHTLELIKALEYQEPHPCTTTDADAQPPQPKPHNPNNLTPEQVGVADGWRLLDEDEVGTAVATRSFSNDEIEAFFENYRGWQRGTFSGGEPRWVYRTKLTREELAAARGLAQPVSEQVDQPDDPLATLAASIFPALRQLIREEIERGQQPAPHWHSTIDHRAHL